jgi:hypothetical protein
MARLAFGSGVKAMQLAVQHHVTRRDKPSGFHGVT